MTYQQWARQLDSAERPAEAAWAYELATREAGADIDVFLDLVALYLSCLDPGFNAGHHLSQGFVNACASRIISVLDEAEARFGAQGEINAWRLYVRERAAYEEVSDVQYRALVHGKNAPALALLRLYLSSGGEEYKQEMTVFRDQLRQLSTERARYLRSVLDSAVISHWKSVDADGSLGLHPPAMP